MRTAGKKAPPTQCFGGHSNAKAKFKVKEEDSGSWILDEENREQRAWSMELQTQIEKSRF